MNQPYIILVWIALIAFISSAFVALWRRDPAPWPAAIALIGAGLFFWCLFTMFAGAPR
jgi:hypothetical protein